MILNRFPHSIWRNICLVCLTILVICSFYNTPPDIQFFQLSNLTTEAVSESNNTANFLEMLLPSENLSVATQQPQEHYFLLVLIVSHKIDQRDYSRKYWNIEQ